MDPHPALAQVEREERVAVLFAIESGSRAWGFPSPDSDWDVRFLYARPTLWHLSLTPGRDVIERPDLPDDLDLSGWDMRKALGLLLKGNCALREWLASPMVYAEQPGFADALRAFALKVPARASALHHYASMAMKQRARWLGRDEVPLKKYLYALRPALALRWLRVHSGPTPPMDLPSLMAEVPLSRGERDAFATLLEAKARSSEMGTGPAIPVLDDLIECELQMVRDEPPLPPASAELIAEADALLVQAARFADRYLAAL